MAQGIMNLYQITSKLHLITDKAGSIVNNIGRELEKKKVHMLGSKDIDTINNSDV